MILVDDQSGSRDLFPYIKKLTPDAIMSRIEPPYGDVAWWGNGPDGQTLRVGIEYKTIDDLLTCIGDGRFAGHQLPGMVEHYDRRYLLVEGRIRADRNTGILQKLSGERWRDISKGGRMFTFRDLEHWYTTVEEQAQFRVVKTYDEWDSARWVVAKHSWWVSKGWDDHKSLQQFHVPPPPTATFVKPALVRRVAKELSGLGWDKSASVAERFKSVRELACASEIDWIKIDGIGKTLSKRIVNEIMGVNR